MRRAGRTTRTTTTALAAVVAVTAVLTGCSAGGGEAIPDGRWMLVHAEVDGASLALDPDSPPSLEVTDDGAAGSGGCNSWFGTLDGDLAAPRLADLGWTEMWCEGLMETEAAYLAALPRVTTGALDDGQLTLTGDQVSLTFEQGDATAAE